MRRVAIDDGGRRNTPIRPSERRFIDRRFIDTRFTDTRFTDTRLTDKPALPPREIPPRLASASVVDVMSALDPSAAIAAMEMMTLRDMMLSAVRGTRMSSPLSRMQVGKRFIAGVKTALR